VEAKPPDSGVEIPAWDGKELGDAGNIFVEGSVEASDLRYPRKCLTKTVDQRDFTGKVIEIERLHPAKLGYDLWCYELMVKQKRTAIDDAMPDCADRGLANSLAQICQRALNAILERCGGDRVSVDFR
jgi:hypothetical protein